MNNGAILYMSTQKKVPLSYGTGVLGNFIDFIYKTWVNWLESEAALIKR